MKKLLVCQECGSTDVDVLAWVNINTNEYMSDAGDSDMFCNFCQEETRVLTNDEYIKNFK